MKKLIIASLLGAMSFGASAQWETGLGYFNMSDEVEEDKFDFGAIVGKLRYDFAPEKKIHWIAGVRYGVGVKAASFELYGYDLDVKLDRFMSIDFRVQNEISEKAYLYAEPSYANTKFTIKSGSYEESNSEWDLGGGVGFGYKFNPKNSIEASYEKFGGTAVISVSWIGTF